MLASNVSDCPALQTFLRLNLLMLDSNSTDRLYLFQNHSSRKTARKVSSNSHHKTTVWNTIANATLSWLLLQAGLHVNPRLEMLLQNAFPPTIYNIMTYFGDISDVPLLLCCQYGSNRKKSALCFSQKETPRIPWLGKGSTQGRVLQLQVMC